MGKRLLTVLAAAALVFAVAPAGALAGTGSVELGTLTYTDAAGVANHVVVDNASPPAVGFRITDEAGATAQQGCSSTPDPKVIICGDGDTRAVQVNLGAGADYAAINAIGAFGIGVAGGDGDDVIDVRGDTGGDIVDCGDGNDQVFAGANDGLAANCETENGAPYVPPPPPTDPGTPVVTTPPPTNNKPPVVTKTPATKVALIPVSSVTAHVKRKSKLKFAISGTVTLPSSYKSKLKTLCGSGSSVRIRPKLGSKTLLTKLVKLKSDCTYKVTVTLKSSSALLKAKSLKFSVRFEGSSAIAGRSAPTATAKLR